MNIKKFSLFSVLFGLVLMAECISLYLGKTLYYQFVRLVSSLLLFLMIYIGDKADVKRIYVYATITFVVLADLFTMFGKTGAIFSIGMSFFTYSYLMLATIMYQKIPNRDVTTRNKIPSLILVIAILIAIMQGINYFTTGLGELLSLLQIFVHSVGIIILSIWAIKLSVEWKRKHLYFIVTTGLILLANICYVFDIYFFERRYILIDVLVVLLHGLYLYTLVRGVNERKKRV